MNNEGNSNLNVILAQLEDELRAIKSARDQADGVVSANSELSAKLERVVIETRGLIEKSNDQTRAAAEALAGEVGRLSEQTDAIKRAAGEGSEVIVKQAADAQAALGQAANDAVEKSSAQMSGLVEQAMSSLNEGIAEARGEISAAAESAKAAAAEIGANSNALLEANEASASENRRNNEETRALLEGAQRHLDEIDANIATLKEIDVSTLAEEVRELKTIETNNAAMLKSKLMTATAMAGASIVLCIAVLVKLFVG